MKYIIETVKTLTKKYLKKDFKLNQEAKCEPSLLPFLQGRLTFLKNHRRGEGQEEGVYYNVCFSFKSF